MRFLKALSISFVFASLLRPDVLRGGPLQPSNSETLQTAQSTTPGAEPSKPESYLDRVRRQGGFVELPLRDAVRLALSNNLEIAIEDFNEDLHRQRLVQTKGFFDPVLSFTVGKRVSDTPVTNALTAGQGVGVFSTHGPVWNTSLQQNVLGGGTLTLTLNNSRTTTNSLFSNLNPTFASDFDIDFIQPLWRGFVRTQTDRQLKLLNLDTKISDRQFKQRVAEIIQRVQNQYWELVFAIESHDTRRQSLELAILQYQQNEVRVRIGVLAPIEITSAQAEVSLREQAMIQDEVQIVTAQNALKGLLARDLSDPIWNLAVVPTDHPSFGDPSMGLQEAIQRALAARPELEQMQLELEKNGVDQAYVAKEGKPTVSLRVNFGAAGRSGTVFRTVPVDLNGDGVPDTQQRVEDPASPLDGNFRRSLREVAGLDFTHYGIFADVRIPLLNRANEGEMAQLTIQRAQLLNRLKQQQQLIAVEVRNAFESLSIQKKRLEAARAARTLSEQQLDGENKRFQAGLSTNFEVLRFQRDLAEAKDQELRAQIDYQLAVVALQKAMFTIISENDLLVAHRGKNGAKP